MFIVERIPGVEADLCTDVPVVDLTLFDLSPELEIPETGLSWDSCDREEGNESREEVEPHG